MYIKKSDKRGRKDEIIENVSRGNFFSIVLELMAYNCNNSGGIWNK
jgi:hypothetical protein